MTLPDTRSKLSRADRQAAVESGLGPELALAGYIDPRWSLAERMAHYRVPGLAVGVIDGDSCDWVGGYGVLENGTSRAVTAETWFPLSCCSQVFVSLAVLQLEAATGLRGDADVNQVLAGWKLPCGEFAAPSVRQLLAHLGGTNVRYFETYTAAEPLPSLRQALDGIAPALNAPVRVIAPGGEFRFSSGGYAVLQQLLADVVRAPFPDVVRALVLDPAGMTQTFFGAAPAPAPGVRIAHGHREDGTPNPLFELRSVCEAACGGWSTCRDLVQLLGALARAYRDTGQRGISSSTARAFFRAPGPEGVGWGSELRGDGESLYMSAMGHHKGYSCVFMLFPMIGRGAVVMTNGTNSRGLTLEVLRSIATVYGWPHLATRRVAYRAPSPEALADACGDYVIGERRISITLDDGALTWHGQRGLQMEAHLTADGHLVLRDGRSFECERSGEGRVIGLKSGSALVARKIDGAPAPGQMRGAASTVRDPLATR